MAIPSLSELQAEPKKDSVSTPLGLGVSESMRNRFMEIKEKYQNEGVNPRKINQLVRDRLAQVFDELEKNLPA